jgi:hypothetical protein
MTNTIKTFVDDRPKITAQQKAFIEGRNAFNPLAVSLKTLEVKEKTVENYLDQIRQNIYVGFKAEYLVCRDLCDAKDKLSSADYSRLKDNLDISKSTISKYEKIGYDIWLSKLFIVGKLPWRWTTCYALTQLDTNQRQKLEESNVLCHDVNLKTIYQTIKFKKPQVKSIENFLLQFGQLEIDKREVQTVSEFKNTLEKLKKQISTFKGVQFNFKEDIEQRISSYLNSKALKQKAKVNNKEITSADSLVTA